MSERPWSDHPRVTALKREPSSGATKLKRATEDVRAFADLLRQNDLAGLTPWLEAAAATDLDGFVPGIRQHKAAVRAAFVEPWSSGPVEGQVNS